VRNLAARSDGRVGLPWLTLAQLLRRRRARLEKLVADGVFERRRYQQHPDRYEYVLTEKGRALGLVVGALRAWGKEWTRGRDLSPRMVHEVCGHEVSVRRYCEECGRPLERDEVRAEQPALAERQS